MEVLSISMESVNMVALSQCLCHGARIRSRPLVNALCPLVVPGLIPTTIAFSIMPEDVVYGYTTKRNEGDTYKSIRRSYFGWITK